MQANRMQPSRTPVVDPRVDSLAVELDPPTIVLAEDDANFRNLLATTLRRMGYSVLEAKGGAQLMSLIQSYFYSGQSVRAPELILSDVRMPGFSGLEVLEWIRSADRLTPVLLITGFGDPALHRRAKELGASHVLDKPFDLSVLRKWVSDTVPLA